MISRKSEFKFIDRGFQDTVVLIPGWAIDYRIFDTLNLNYNYLLPIEFSLSNFNQGLLESLNKKTQRKIALLGCSLGGFLASSFAAEFPDMIDRLILLGIRKNYDDKTLKDITFKLKDNKRAYLYKFYLNCFSKNDKQATSWFRKRLLKEYLDKMDLKNLIAGLEYLSTARIAAKGLYGIRRIEIFHGQEDLIAPLEEAREIKDGLQQAEFIELANTGHLCFLNAQFKEKFHHG